MKNLNPLELNIFAWQKQEQTGERLSAHMIKKYGFFNIKKGS